MPAFSPRISGLPCYLLETLASGRPVGAIELPQSAPLFLPGVSGALVARGESHEDCAEALAEAFESLWQDIKSGRVHPARLHTLIEPYSVETQFGRLFAMGFKRRMYCNRNCHRDHRP
jgi:hypothetical protein